MSGVYNKEYYDNYDVGIGKVDYSTNDDLKFLFEVVAAKLIEDFNPKTVLDAGCAMGYLVAALRDRGVEAYGVDISEYAISKVREDIKPYCFVGSLTEPLPDGIPDKYDLITNIEVLEHIYAEDGEKAIENLCSLSDCVIFSSTPDDFTERTHVNVQQREYWARLFAAQGFFDDINYRPTYLTAYASCFRRKSDWLRQVEDYERNIRMSEAEWTGERLGLNKAIEDKERHIQNQNKIIDDKERHIQDQNKIIEDKERHIQNQNKIIENKDCQLQVQKLIVEDKEKCIQDQQHTIEEQIVQLSETEDLLAYYKGHYNAAINQREELKAQLAAANAAYQSISNAACWKMTAPLRKVLDGIKYIMQKNKFTRLVGKGLKCWRQNGFKYTWNKVKDKLHHRQNFQAAALKPLYTAEELDAQRKYEFPRKIKISIVVPLYNTPKQFLEEMIRSVLDQTYSDWELCMADGSDEKHGYVKSICLQYAKSDKRIKYKRLTENKGISENTNACIEMASGEYIGLLDHDDLLHPAALYNVMEAICEKNADMTYTDEATFESPNVNKIITAHFKPDYAVDNLRANNYICHFTVFKKELLAIVGVFRHEYDGSQDHDMMLRLTSASKIIVHIPKLLYYWRSHPQSVSQDITAKEYAISAGKNAVRDSIEKHGLKAVVESSRAFPTIYRIKYEIQHKDKVSIIIPNRDHYDDLKRCIDSIFIRSTYKNFEIVIVDNGSVEEDVINYYKTLEEDPRVKIGYLNDEFNYSKLNNLGASLADGKYYILLNNDTEVITPEWIEELLMFVQRDDVAAAGAMLYYPDNTIQHAGVILGVGTHRVAGHAFHRESKEWIGYMGRLCYAQDVSAVTAACMMVKASAYKEVCGFDETIKVAYNDVDFCLKLRQKGYLIVWTPHAELYHYESKSRGLDDTPEKRKRFENEVERFQSRWKKELAAGDPYYNPNLTLDKGDFSIR